MQVSRLKKKPTFVDLSDGLDGFSDSLYLSESIWAYSDNVSEVNDLENDNCNTHDFYITTVAFFAVLGLLKAYSNVFRKDFDLDRDCIKKNYQIFRDTISAIKNGRHAVENVAQLHLISLGKAPSSSYSFLTPVGGVAVGVGVLLCVSNFFRNKYIKQRGLRLEAYEKFKSLNKGVEEHPVLKICERYNMIKDIEDLRSKRCNYKLLILEMFHSLTDALYQVGNAYMLLTLVGVTASGPFGIGCLASAYILYSISLMVSNYYGERKKQLGEELKYYEFVYEGCDKQKKIDKAKDNISMFNSSNIARMVVLMACIRKTINHLKNNLAAVTGIGFLFSNISLEELKKNHIIGIIGLSLGVMFCIKSAMKYTKNHPNSNINLYPKRVCAFFNGLFYSKAQQSLHLLN